MRAAITAVRQLGAARVIVAVPVGPPETCDALGREADGCVCLRRPAAFLAVAQWYVDFPQVTDAEVVAALAATPIASPALPSTPSPR